jgi:hypothetical protein
MIKIEDIIEDRNRGSIYLFVEEAKNFLKGKVWCKQIKEGYLGLGIEGILAVFLFNILPIDNSIDEKLWVIVGDIPPAYLVIDNAPNALGALKLYVKEMSKWVQAVKKHESLADIIPVNVPPKEEYAIMLDKRLKFIVTEIIPEYRDEFEDKIDI